MKHERRHRVRLRVLKVCVFSMVFMCGLMISVECTYMYQQECAFLESWAHYTIVRHHYRRANELNQPCSQQCCAHFICALPLKLCIHFISTWPRHLLLRSFKNNLTNTSYSSEYECNNCICSSTINQIDAVYINLKKNHTT